MADAIACLIDLLLPRVASVSGLDLGSGSVSQHVLRFRQITFAESL